MSTEAHEFAASFSKNTREIVGIKLVAWRGEDRLDIRIYVPSPDDESLIPTRKGVSLPLPLVGEVLEAVQRLERWGEDDFTAARIELSPSRQVHIGTNTYRDRRLIFVRTYVPSLEEGGVNWVPSRKGVSVRLDLISELSAALELANSKARNQEWRKRDQLPLRRVEDAGTASSNVESPIQQAALERPVASLPLSNATKGALMRRGLTTLGQLVKLHNPRQPKLSSTVKAVLSGKGLAEVDGFLAAEGWLIPASIPEVDMAGVEDVGPSTASESLLHLANIADTTLPVRVRNSLLRAGMTTVASLMEAYRDGSIMKVRSFGKKSLADVEEFFSSLGIDPNFPVHASGKSALIEQRALQFGPGGHSQDSIDLAAYEVLSGLPVTVLSAYLPTPVIHSLEADGLQNIGGIVSAPRTVTSSAVTGDSHLRALPEKLIADFRKEPRRAIADMLVAHFNLLKNRLNEGGLHPEVEFLGTTLARWLTISSSEAAEGDNVWLLVQLSRANLLRTLDEELSRLFDDIGSRSFDIFIHRFGNKGLTLQQLAEKHDLTRERIRQLERRVSTRIRRSLGRYPSLILRSAILWSRDMGDSISLHALESALKDRAVMEAGVQATTGMGNFAVFCGLVRMLGKAEDPVISIPANLLKSLDAGGLTVGAYTKLEGITSAQCRTIRREAYYTGGISVESVARNLNIEPSTAKHLLAYLGMIEVIDGWYSFASADQVSRWPLVTAVLKVMEACGPIGFKSLASGIRRYASRFFPALAPYELVRHSLQVYGFTIEHELVSYSGDFGDTLSESERAFLQAAKLHGPLVSLYEVAEVFQDLDLSLPAASRTLRMSPIVEQYERGLYMLRGHEPQWDEIEEVRARQLRISGDPEVSYATDATVRYRITVNQYGSLTGVLNAHTLPDLGGDWEITTETSRIETANMDENFIWGLKQAFDKLGIAVGDRILLTFDTRNRQLSLRKLADGR